MTTRGEPGESSTQAAQAEDEPSESVTTIHEELKKLELKLKKEVESTSPKPRIRKVPRLLIDTVDKRKKYFEPKVLCLGPFHRKLEEKYVESKQLKLKAASLFMNANTPGDVDEWKRAYEKIRKKVDGFMKLYALEPKQSQESRAEYAGMFFLDGCAAMYFICGAIGAAKSGIKTHELIFAEQDLLLLENQLPLEVLKVLENWRFPNLKKKNFYMEEFIERQIPTKGRRNVVRKDEHDPIHLLHLMRTRLQEATSSNEKLMFDTTHPYPCHSAVELRKRGICFGVSPSRRKKQVDFNKNSLSAVLYLPSIIIDDLSKGKLLNLVADEMSSDVPNSLEIASYICFLDSLVDDAKDVKLLCEANIIRNGLGRDGELANLLHEMTENLVPNNEIYKGVMAAIQSHFNNNTKTLMAEFAGDLSRAPWTIISFVAAIFLFSCNLIQTYLSFVPAASKERNQWVMIWHVVKHLHIPILLVFPMISVLLYISCVSVLVIRAHNRYFVLPEPLRISSQNAFPQDVYRQEEARQEDEAEPSHSSLDPYAL